METAPLLSALSFFCPLGPHGVYALKGKLCHKVFCLALRCFHALKISIGKWKLLVPVSWFLLFCLPGLRCRASGGFRYELLLSMTSESFCSSCNPPFTRSDSAMSLLAFAYQGWLCQMKSLLGTVMFSCFENIHWQVEPFSV